MVLLCASSQQNIRSLLPASSTPRSIQRRESKVLPQISSQSEAEIRSEQLLPNTCHHFRVSRPMHYEFLEKFFATEPRVIFSIATVFSAALYPIAREISDLSSKHNGAPTAAARTPSSRNDWNFPSLNLFLEKSRRGDITRNWYRSLSSRAGRNNQMHCSTRGEFSK